MLGYVLRNIRCRGLLPVLVFLLSLAPPGPAPAHSLRGRTGVTPPLKTYFDELRTLARDLPAGAIGVRGVLDQFKLWPATAPILVCFNGGEQALRAVFVQTSQRWTPLTSLKFDFGWGPDYRTCTPGDGASIRVSFSSDGNWSFIGTDSLKYKDTTLNIGYAAEGPLSALDRKELETIILHEVGHAIGLEHEHQSPESKCEEEFDWPKVYAFASTEWGWTKTDGQVDKDMVDFNLRALASGERLRITPYDRQSIMHYYFEPELFKRGRASHCFVAHNNSLSPIDRQMVAEAYPAEVSAQENQLQKRANAASSILALLNLTSYQLSRIGRELSVVLGSAPRKIILDFDLARATGRAVTRGVGDFQLCQQEPSASEATNVAVACEVATDASALLIAVEPK